MKAWMKIVLGISLSVMCLFSCLGYAQLTRTLSISGEMELKPPDAIFILEMSEPRTSGATVNTVPTNIGYPSTKVLSEIVFSKRGSYVEFDVVIVNGTSFTQYYDTIEKYTSLEGLGGTFSHANTTATLSLAQGTAVAPGETVEAVLRITYNGTNSNQTRRMLHEIDFVLNSNDLTEAVSKDVTDKFEDILNNRLEEDITYSYGNNTETINKDNTYNAVISHMESDSSGNYIGNLMGADADDKALLTALFEGALTFTVGNDEVPITVMVKEKNVIGASNSAKEMVLFITADDLSARNTYVPVYAAVYQKDSEGNWQHAGEIFAGEARTNDYSGWYGSGSFNTESWRSTQMYYGVAIRSGINAVISGYLSQNP